MQKDISERIESDFGNKAPDVFKLLQKVISTNVYLNNDRIIRCILFLAEKDFLKLKKNIDAAITDPRDVMLWAEYVNPGDGKDVKRVRNFNNTFENADKDIPA